MFKKGLLNLISRSFIFLIILAPVGCEKEKFVARAPKEKKPMVRKQSFVRPHLSTMTVGGKIPVNRVTASGLASLFRCNEPSTAIRLAPQSYSVTHVFHKLWQDQIGMGPSVVAEKVTYATETEGELFTLNHELLEMAYRGASAIVGVPYSYVMNCTTELGCDWKKKIFHSGSAWEKAQSIAQLRKLQKIDNFKRRSYECEYKNPEVNQKVNETFKKQKLVIFGEKRTAVEYSRIAAVEVFCNGDFIGLGKQKNKAVILSDRLPHLGEFSVNSIGSHPIGCKRTQVFAGKQVEFGGKIFEGSTEKLFEYNLNGKVKSVNAWRTQVDSYQKNKLALEQAVAVAQARVKEAKSFLSNAKATSRRKMKNLNVSDEKVSAAQKILSPKWKEKNKNAGIEKGNQISKRDPSALIETIKRSRENTGQPVELPPDPSKN